MTSFIQNTGKLQPKKPEKIISDLARNTNLLSISDEFQLYTNYKNGCQKSFNKLFNSHLRLVYKIASKFCKFNLNLKEDLVSEGMVGLAYAIRKFDPKKGRLCTYCAPWIKSFIEKYYVKNCFGNISISSDTDSKKTFYELKKIGQSNNLNINNLDDDEIKKIAKKLNVNEIQVKNIHRRITKADSQDIINELHSKPNQSFDNNDQDIYYKLKAVKDVAKNLKPQQNRIFFARNFENKSLKEISKYEKVSLQRVSFIEKQAYKFIKNAIKIKNSEEVLSVL